MKTKFVTGLSVFTLAVSVLTLVLGVMEFFVLNILSSQPEVRSILLESLRQQYGVAITLEQLQSMLIRHINTSLFSGLLGIFLGVALLKRWSWGRQAFIIALILATLVMIFAAVFSPSLKEGMLYWAGIGLSLVAAVLHLWIILRLRTLEIRQEFKS